MTIDPTTREGLAEIKKRAKKTKEFAKKMRLIAEKNPDDEPTGKITRPNEMDLHRDRKNDE
jgi:hypothetical protein